MIRKSWNKNKEWVSRWEDFRANLIRTTPVPQMTDAEKAVFKQKLEKDPEAWMEFMFPKYYTSKPAPFHIKATRRLLKNKRHYQVRRWARELAKSVRGMMEDLNMALTGEAKTFLLVSHNKENADELLMPYLINLESNPRLIWLYGEQAGFRSWEVGRFVTRRGASFRGIGAGQSPRGTRNEERRPDVLRIDDIDTDERCRSEKRIRETWAWVEQALIPTVSVSGNARIIFQGNLISKNSIIARASEMADHVDTVNIRDKNGNSSWPEKNSEDHINWLLSKISYISAQKEYYNNPITEGTVFKQMFFKKIERLQKYRFLVAYGDPSFKESRHNDFKFVVLMGQIDGELHVLKAWGDQTTTAVMAGWYQQAHEYVGGAVPVYYIIEANATQDLIFEQIKKYARENNYNYVLSGDYRAKGDKFSRIEAALEPMNTNGRFYLNEAEKENPGMMLLKEQFIALTPELAGHDDGPDACEGGKYILEKKTVAQAGITFGERGKGTYKNNKRY